MLHHAMQISTENIAFLCYNKKKVNMREELIQIYQVLPQVQQRELLDFASFLAHHRHTVTPPPSTQTIKKRQPGGLPGKVWMAPDFDAPVADFAEYM